jgi:quercetin dioxygenase-like cupin family protein
LIFALSSAPHDAARFRIAHEREDGAPLVWELLDEAPADAFFVEVELPREGWIARLDRVEFPPGGIAYRHVHPGPGIRYLLYGELTIDRVGGDVPHTYYVGDAWFEDAEDPVRATASELEDTAFVRVLLLPAEWAGKRTIRYVDPADEDRPRLQRATVLSEEPVRL